MCFVLVLVSSSTRQTKKSSPPTKHTLYFHLERTLSLAVWPPSGSKMLGRYDFCFPFVLVVLLFATVLNGQAQDQASNARDKKQLGRSRVPPEGAAPGDPGAQQNLVGPGVRNSSHVKPASRTDGNSEV